MEPVTGTDKIFVALLNPDIFPKEVKEVDTRPI
jgi:hypothetical protein